MTTILSLFAHVDRIRQLLIEKLSEMLLLDDRYKTSSDPSASTLTEDERAHLERLIDELGLGMRRTFRDVVNGLCLYVGEILLHLNVMARN